MIKLSALCLSEKESSQSRGAAQNWVGFHRGRPKPGRAENTPTHTLHLVLYASPHTPTQPVSAQKVPPRCVARVGGSFNKSLTSCSRLTRVFHFPTLLLKDGENEQPAVPTESSVGSQMFTDDWQTAHSKGPAASERGFRCSAPFAAFKWSSSLCFVG